MKQNLIPIPLSAFDPLTLRRMWRNLTELPDSRERRAAKRAIAKEAEQNCGLAEWRSYDKQI